MVHRQLRHRPPRPHRLLHRRAQIVADLPHRAAHGGGLPPRAVDLPAHRLPGDRGAGPARQLPADPARAALRGGDAGPQAAAGCRLPACRPAPLRQPFRPAAGARSRRLHPAGPAAERADSGGDPASRSPDGERRRRDPAHHRRGCVPGRGQRAGSRRLGMSEAVAPPQPRRAWWRLDGTDLRWLLGLTLLAAVLRFGSPLFPNFLTTPGTGPPFTVWGIGHDYKDPRIPGLGQQGQIAPNSPFVFDELYFANDARDDLNGRDYLDPEPPLAKLIIALGIKLFGFNSFGWRLMPALFGTALIPLMYLLARQLLAVRFFAIAAGVLTAFDGMTFVEARTAVIDIIPITPVLLGYLLFHLPITARTFFPPRLALSPTSV